MDYVYFIGIGIGFLAVFWFVRVKLVIPLRRIRELTDNLAQGQPSGGYITNGILGTGEIIRNLSIIDEKLGKVTTRAEADKFSLQAVMSSMVEGVVITDEKRIIQLENRAFREMFSLKNSSKQKTVIEVLVQVEIENLINQAFLEKKQVRGEVFIGNFVEAEKLSPHVFSVSVSPLKDNSNRIEGFVLLFYDISRLKQLENLRKEFVANISHELRTPLSIFRGYLETLTGKGSVDIDPQDMQDALQVMKRNSNRLVTLVEDLLTLTRLESGNFPLSLKPVEVRELIQSLHHDWKIAFKENSSQLKENCQFPSLLTIQADQVRLEQVFQNLIDNALKYGGHKVEVEIGALHSETESYIDFYIKDNGNGIPEDKTSRIFERFYRVDRARSREKGGTGLGLSIVKHIVQAHKGRVRAMSEVGKGTTIWIRLPLKFSEENDSNVPEFQDL